ncbi:hypothetical protein [Paludisphaera mucosa]|uniref:Lipoprotein n=1 Tax=Paludisphaera mucosa TaxID=3030827 RepID=A0ABT6FF15_9BACT|nr:hypothetical protein [Paludisphaera mucosa]MDG3006156.1 hypothetical protein [Paludisphaera mucosa]
MGNMRDGRSWFARGLAAAAALVVGTVAMAVDDGGKKAEAPTCACCAAKAGGLSGIWTGEYKYSEGSGQRPVAFTAFLFQQGDRIKAEIKEANTFGDDRSPWLHATVEGRYDEAERALNFTKTYDGTAGVSHEVVYKGVVDSEGSRVVEGTWDVSGTQGTFTMRRKASSD